MGLVVVGAPRGLGAAAWGLTPRIPDATPLLLGLTAQRNEGDFLAFPVLLGFQLAPNLLLLGQGHGPSFLLWTKGVQPSLHHSAFKFSTVSEISPFRFDTCALRRRQVPVLMREACSL
jgi:hypothetical protein